MRIVRNLLLVTALASHGCAPVQVISEQSIDNKLSQVKLGVTTKAEVENLFGRDHNGEDRLWIYSLSDTALGISERSPGSFLPTPEMMPTNTRAVITVRFNESRTVDGLEVERYFNPPFINDYWYIFKAKPENILESAMRAGEANNFRVVGLDKSPGKFALENDSSKARITLQLEQQTLHITSINPYDRLANEYRVFTKRESAFIDTISALTAETIVSPPATPQQPKKTDDLSSKDNSGNEKPLTAESIVSSPATPQKLPKTAHLSWKDNSGNEKGFRIYRIRGNQKIKIAELGPNITSYIDKNASPKACYVVTAFNSAGESFPTNKVCRPD
jgi:hypothetical protein